MVGGPGGLDQFFCPSGRLIVLDEITEDASVCRDRGGDVEFVGFGCPAKCDAQIRQLAAELLVCLTLLRAIPQRHDWPFTRGEIPRMRGPNLFCRTVYGNLFIGELPNRLQH